MKDSLSIRAYTKTAAKHAHDFAQLVLPLNGFIHLQAGVFSGKVGVGEAIVIPAGQLHTFSAHEQARFVVADLATLPPDLQHLNSPKFRLTQAISAFLAYVEIQLQHTTDDTLAYHLVELFKQILAQQPGLTPQNSRLDQAVSYIHHHPEAPLSIGVLANIACLGETQFKKRFKHSTGVSVGSYITQVRMNKARSLLRFTDMPVTRVAQEVGYQDVSAFSRRFRLLFGRSPKHFARQ